MKLEKLGKVVGIVALVIVLLVIIGVIALNSFLKSEQFKRILLNRIETLLNVPVEMDDFRASLFSGVRLQKLLIKNPPGFEEGYFLKADMLLLRYDFFALLRRNIRITEVRLKGPNIHLQEKEDGIWNFQLISAKMKTSKAEVTGERRDKNRDLTGIVVGRAEASPESGDGVKIAPFSVDKIDISGGKFLYSPTEKSKTVTVHNFGLNGQIRSLKPTPQLKVSLSIERIDGPQRMRVEELEGYLRASKGKAYLDEISLYTLGGSLVGKGESTIPSNQQTPEYKATLSIYNIDLNALMSEFLPKNEGVIKGVASADITFQGKGSQFVADVELTIPSILIRDQIQLDRVKSNIRYSMPDFTIEALTLNVFGGTIDGKGSGNLSNPAAPSFDVNLTIRGVNVASVLKALGQDPPPAQGKIKGDIHVSGPLSRMKADGTLYSQKLNIVKGGILTDLKAPFTATVAGEKMHFNVDRFSAKMYGGSIGGKVTFTLPIKGKGAPEFSTRLKVSSLEINRAVKTLTGQSLMRGRLEGRIRLKGQTSDVTTLKGKTELAIKNGRISGHPIQNVLALVLQMPVLKSIDFAKAEFLSTIQGGTLDVKTARIESPKLLKFTSNGTIKLGSQKLFLPSHLSLHRSTINRIPQIKGAFTREEEPWYGIDFKIFGTLSKPKTDLTSKLTTEAIFETLRDVIDKREGEEEEGGGAIEEIFQEIFK
ncbi:MAG TPA: AsmA family protein [Candidatus Omnitrophica bacterium]|nr:AsmA family protein [Candidatus Omnitrophota bacterium]